MRAAFALDQVQRGDREVLEARHRGRDDLERRAVAGALLEFGACRGSHVKAGEHRVHDTDLRLSSSERRFFAMVASRRSVQCREKALGSRS